MLGIVVLHESVAWKGLVDEWNERCLENAAVKFSIHDSIKDTYLCGAVSAYSCPDVNFKRMLRLWFSFRWLINLLVACTPVLLQGDGAFITEDDVGKGMLGKENCLSLCVSEVL